MFFLTLMWHSQHFELWTGFQMKMMVCLVIRQPQPVASPAWLSCLWLCFYEVERSFHLHSTRHTGSPLCAVWSQPSIPKHPLPPPLIPPNSLPPSLPVTRRVRTFVFSLRMFTVTFLADWKYSGLPWNKTTRPRVWDGDGCLGPAWVRHLELCPALTPRLGAWLGCTYPAVTLPVQHKPRVDTTAVPGPGSALLEGWLPLLLV